LEQEASLIAIGYSQIALLPLIGSFLNLIHMRDFLSKILRRCFSTRNLDFGQLSLRMVLVTWFCVGR